MTGPAKRRRGPSARFDRIEAEVQRMMAMGREIRSHMTEPVSSDLSDLYDANGFPIDDRDVVTAAAEPKTKR